MIGKSFYNFGFTWAFLQGKRKLRLCPEGTDRLSAAAVFVFSTGTTGAGLVAADFSAGRNGNFFGLSWGGSFFHGDVDLVDGVDDLIVDASDEAFE